MDDRPRIAIVGAGLAGLTCAYRLHQRGAAEIVYEASGRIGGRCWTARGFADGQVAEHGGELIDPSHERIIGLAAELGLELEDRSAAAAAEGRPMGTGGAARIDGRMIARSQRDGDIGPLVIRAAESLEAAGDLRHDRANDAARALDEMTGREWIDANVDGAGDSITLRVLETALHDIFGLPIEHIGACMVIMLLAEAAEAARAADAEGAALQVWDLMDVGVTAQSHVRGGNDQIPERMAAALPEGSVVLGSPLDRLRRAKDGTYRLRFSSSAEETSADLVVLALPFSTLREVDLDASGLPKRRRRCIDELLMGSNTKLLLQFDRRFSAFDSWPGMAVDDDPEIGRLAFWDSSLTQPGSSGLLTTFTGSKAFEADTAHGPPSAESLERGLAAAEVFLPGARARFNGHAWLDSWPDDPWARGSYSAYGPGSMTRYLGFVGEAEGGVHFAGEHTAIRAQGYLEGAVESGERAAAQILAAVS